jgi:hypothetical protein
MFIFVLILMLIEFLGDKNKQDLLESGRHSFITLLFVYSLIYIVFLITSITLFDASTRLNNRILSPLYICFFLLLFVLIGHRARKGQWRSQFVLAILLGYLALFSSYVCQSSDLLTNMHDEGLGFTSRAWTTSQTIKAIREMPEDAIFYTNEAFPLIFITGRVVYSVPEIFDPVKAELRPEFEGQMDIMRSHLKQPGSALVIFHPSHLRLGFPDIHELTQGLVLLVETDDGAIYVYPTSLYRYQSITH